MKPDLYTRTVLTVIAACLLWLCMERATVPVSAAPGATKVTIAEFEPYAIRQLAPSDASPLPVRIMGGKNYGLLKVDEDNPLPVAIMNAK